MSIEFTAEQLDQLVQSTLPFFVKDKLFAQADQSTPALNKFREKRKTYAGGQEIIINGYFSGTRIDVRYRPDVGTGKNEMKFKAIVTSDSFASPNDDMASMDVTLRATGDFSRSPQA